MIFRLCLFLGSLLFLMTACHRNIASKVSFEGFTYDETYAFWFKRVPPLNGTIVKVGEEVELEYTMQKGDTVLVNSRLIDQEVLVDLPTSEFDNFFTQALKYMGEGDSLCQLIKASDANQLLGGFAAHFKSDEWVTITYKITKVNSSESVAQKIEKEQARIETIRDTVQTLIKQYKSGDLVTQKAPEAPIDYVMLESTAGQPAKLGDQLTAHYICLNQYGAILDDTYVNLVPLEFRLGDLNFLDGWNKSFQLMKEGDTGIFFVPPSLAYGDNDKAEIQGMLVFYLELISID